MTRGKKKKLLVKNMNFKKQISDTIWPRVWTQVHFSMGDKAFEKFMFDLPSGLARQIGRRNIKEMLRKNISRDFWQLIMYYRDSRLYDQLSFQLRESMKS